MDDLTVFRHQKHLTQRVLAARVGMSIQILRLWEGGTSQPRAQYIPQLAEALGVEPDELVGPTDGNG